MKYLKAFILFVVLAAAIFILRMGSFKMVSDAPEKINHLAEYWELTLPQMGEVKKQVIEEGDESYRYTIYKVAKDAELKSLDTLGFRDNIDDESQEVIAKVYEKLEIPDNSRFSPAEDIRIKKITKDQNTLVILTNKSVPEYYFFEYIK